MNLGISGTTKRSDLGSSHLCFIFGADGNFEQLSGPRLMLQFPQDNRLRLDLRHPPNYTVVSG